jgi:AtzH-like
LLASSIGYKYERDMQINIPEVLAELTAQFNEYERALLANEPDVLIGLFWCDPRTVRFGVAENLYGAEEIAAYRKARAGKGGAPQRKTTRAVITTYGRDFGTTNIEYVRTESGKAGRQSQTWMRTPEGWRIVAAHVSLLVDEDR